jgi:hypothetical protein
MGPGCGQVQNLQKDGKERLSQKSITSDILAVIIETLKHFQIQKFNGKNFQLWKYQMEIIFRLKTRLFDLKRNHTSIIGKLRKAYYMG